MVKAKRKAQLKATPISEFETRPWRCPRCLKRVKTKAGLIGHWKGKHKSLPVPANLVRSARDGKKLEKKTNVQKKTRTEVFKRGREKGQKAPSRVRDIEVMRKGIEDYRIALESGETSKEYKNRTGRDKSLISKWRSKVKKADSKIKE